MTTFKPHKDVTIYTVPKLTGGGLIIDIHDESDPESDIRGCVALNLDQASAVSQALLDAIRAVAAEKGH